MNEGYDCVLGSCFIRVGGVTNYPKIELFLNRLADFLEILSDIRLNDTTNVFKAYRKNAMDHCRPLIAAHFNITHVRGAITGSRRKIAPRLSDSVQAVADLCLLALYIVVLAGKRVSR